MGVERSRRDAVGAKDGTDGGRPAGYAAAVVPPWARAPPAADHFRPEGRRDSRPLRRKWARRGDSPFPADGGATHRTAPGDRPVRPAPVPGGWRGRTGAAGGGLVDRARCPWRGPRKGDHGGQSGSGTRLGTDVRGEGTGRRRWGRERDDRALCRATGPVAGGGLTGYSDPFRGRQRRVGARGMGGQRCGAGGLHPVGD